MNIYTSYFGKIKKLVDKYKLIAVSRSFPSFFYYDNYIKLAPSWGLIHLFKSKSIDELEYYNLYYEEVLNKLDPNKIFKDLKFISNNKNIVLMCWETPEKFCHRHIIADWLKEKLNINVKEI